jgi:hypothetical protein
MVNPIQYWFYTLLLCVSIKKLSYKNEDVCWNIFFCILHFIFCNKILIICKVAKYKMNEHVLDLLIIDPVELVCLATHWQSHSTFLLHLSNDLHVVQVPIELNSFYTLVLCDFAYFIKYYYKWKWMLK